MVQFYSLHWGYSVQILHVAYGVLCDALTVNKPLLVSVESQVVHLGRI